jgi:hypothetical protein
MPAKSNDIAKLENLANGTEGATEPNGESQPNTGATGTVESTERVKRAYTKHVKVATSPEFSTMELFALEAILSGDKNVASGWVSHLLAKVTPFIPTRPDLSIGPDANVGGGTPSTDAS